MSWRPASSCFDYSQCSSLAVYTWALVFLPCYFTILVSRHSTPVLIDKLRQDVWLRLVYVFQKIRSHTTTRGSVFRLLYWYGRLLLRPRVYSRAFPQVSWWGLYYFSLEFCRRCTFSPLRSHAMPLLVCSKTWYFRFRRAKSWRTRDPR